MRPTRATNRSRTDARPWSLRRPSSRPSRSAGPAWRTAFHPDPAIARTVVSKVLPAAEQLGSVALFQRVVAAPIRRPPVARRARRPSRRSSTVAPSSNPRPRADGVDGRVPGLGNVHSQWRTVPTRDSVSSGVTTGAFRICSRSTLYDGAASRPARCRMCSRPPAVPVGPRSVADRRPSPSGTPRGVCSLTNRWTTPGPSCTLPAPARQTPPTRGGHRPAAARRAVFSLDCRSPARAAGRPTGLR